ncbi:molybdopterin cofactor-binding domain-containing protein [Roseobacter sp.]|uniref:xanthine dehydrogenase family protein molybdopterin-binding subunit n=1 Tax=Roseobacter sp. TaxID=1907202 RepID=UPI00344D6D50
MQALLIAEEMDLEPGGFVISPGVPARAYRNRALSRDMVPFMSTDQRFVARAGRSVAESVMKLLALQVTGGSSSVPDSYDKLRHAGAVARETLKAAAAMRTGIPVAQLSTAKGAVLLPDGERIPYPDLASDAAEIPPVTDVDLRPPAAWRLIGQPVERIDIRDKSTGKTRYGIDEWQADMLFASVRASPRRGGALLGYDATRARQMPGVLHVLDLPDAVAVVADNTWNAFQALEEISFDWGPTPFPADQDAHWQILSDAFDTTRAKVWRDDGDVSHLSGAWREYRAPYVAHQPLEPLNATIRVDGERAEIRTTHQMPGLARDKVAEITGLPAAHVTFHNLPGGGSFGHRLEFDIIEQAAETGRQLPGVTIKVTLSREEDFARDIPRQIAMARARGAVSGGQVTALDLQIAAPSVTRSQTGRAAFEVPGPDLQTVAGAWNMPFAIPDLRVSGRDVEGLAPVSSWRSVGAATAGFFAESALDELIRDAGADPMAERLRLVRDPVARGVLEAVAEMSGWGRGMAPQEGRGVALVSSFGVPVAQVVDVTATQQGIRIDRVFVAADVGLILDPVNFENQVQGGVVWGLGHAINSEITYANGQAEQSNYHAAPGLRLWQTPQIVVRGLQTAQDIRGIGEPPVPPVAPALAGAVFAATGQRLREMPFARHIAFV